VSCSMSRCNNYPLPSSSATPRKVERKEHSIPFPPRRRRRKRACRGSEVRKTSNRLGDPRRLNSVIMRTLSRHVGNPIPTDPLDAGCRAPPRQRPPSPARRAAGGDVATTLPSVRAERVRGRRILRGRPTLSTPGRPPPIGMIAPNVERARPHKLQPHLPPGPGQRRAKGSPATAAAVAPPPSPSSPPSSSRAERSTASKAAATPSDACRPPADPSSSRRPPSRAGTNATAPSSPPPRRPTPASWSTRPRHQPARARPSYPRTPSTTA
jgi:hypothetical protein